MTPLPTFPKPDLRVRYADGLRLDLHYVGEPAAEPRATFPMRRNPGQSSELLCEAILRDYQSREVELGAEGSPTPEQQRHWRQHLIMPHREACHICLRQYARAFGAAKPPTRRPTASPASGGTTIVRRLPASSPRPALVRVSSSDLGF